MHILQNTLASATDESGTLVIHLLNQCNLHCRHCYMNAVSHHGTMLPFDLVHRALQDAVSLGIRTVHLTGGEPFLYPEIEKLLKSLTRPLQFQLFLSTNGTKIGTEQRQWIKDAHAGVQISIDGPEEYHDRFRGMSGAFAASTETIRALVSDKINVAAVITITRENKDMLPWIAEWARTNKVERVSVQPLQAIGRGSQISDSMLSEPEMLTLFSRLSDLGHKYSDAGLRFSLHYKARSFLLEHPCAAYVCNGARCHRLVSKEIKRLIIREDGTVLPEIATLNPQFALGNLNQTNLPELIRRYFNDGYTVFQEFCRKIYAEVIPQSTSPIIPWDEIVSERSWKPSNQAVA